MRTKLFTLALLLVSTLTFAQTAFTKATLDGILAIYQKNPHEFFKNYCSPDFRYINREGAFVYLPELLKVSVNDKIESTEILDQKIRQSGDVAVVSGIHVANRVAADGTRSVSKVACTYTFQRQRGNGLAPRWLFVASQQSNLPQNQSGSASADEAAIKTVLEGHTQASMDRDAEKAISYLANSPNVAVSYNVPGYPRGYDVVAGGYRKILGSMPKSTDKLSTSDYRYRIVGNTAFVTSIEIYTKPDGTVSKMHKVNYLEQEGGQWKMVGNFWMPEVK